MPPKSPARKGAPEAAAPSRAKVRIDGDLDLYYPPLPAEVGYVVGYLNDLGCTGAAGMGMAVLSFVEIEAYQRLSGNALQPWEVRAIRAMSGAFLGEWQEAESPSRPAPWSPEPQELDRAKLARRIKDVLRG